MRIEEFKAYMQQKTYISKDGESYYTEQGINKRIVSLQKVEVELNCRLDEFIKEKDKVIEILIKIREKALETRRHTPLSNAVRLYYEFSTGDRIGRIF